MEQKNIYNFMKLLPHFSDDKMSSIWSDKTYEQDP